MKKRNILKYFSCLKNFNTDLPKKSSKSYIFNILTWTLACKTSRFIIANSSNRAGISCAFVYVYATSSSGASITRVAQAFGFVINEQALRIWSTNYCFARICKKIINIVNKKEEQNEFFFRKYIEYLYFMKTYVCNRFRYSVQGTNICVVGRKWHFRDNPNFSYRLLFRRILFEHPGLLSFLLDNGKKMILVR